MSVYAPSRKSQLERVERFPGPDTNQPPTRGIWAPGTDDPLRALELLDGFLGKRPEVASCISRAEIALLDKRRLQILDSRSPQTERKQRRKDVSVGGRRRWWRRHRWRTSHDGRRIGRLRSGLSWIGRRRHHRVRRERRRRNRLLR